MSELHAYLRRLADHIRKVEEKRGVRRDLFISDHAIHDHVVFQLIQIGEITRKLPEDFRKEHSGLPWKDMIAFRNVLVHNYDGINLEIVWKIVEIDLPLLKEFVVTYLENKND